MGACSIVFFERFLLITNQIRAAITIATTTPPITPPTIGPVFDFLAREEVVGVGVLVEDVDVDVEVAELDDTFKR
jgi:hypothetical protein